MMRRIIFITENVNKFRELDAYLQNFKVANPRCGNVMLEMMKPEYEIHEIQSLNREEIIIHKLHAALDGCRNLLTISSASTEETWVLVEDTSLCISKLGGFPGPFVKFFLQSMPLKSIGNDNWGSSAQSIVNLAVGRLSFNDHHAMELSITHSVQSIIDGFIVNARGTNGFGFDPIFRPVKASNTNAEMSMDEKARFNPRTQAFQKVLEYLHPL
jgi:inosine triphosphate pyrophosphatase